MAKFLPNQRKCILVIELGKASFKIASFLRSSSKLELLDYSLERLGPQPESKARIVNAIRAFLKKNSLSVKESILSIADADSVAIKYCLLPALKYQEILSAAIWQLKDEVHFELKDAYSDWRVVKELTDEQGARQQGIIFAFSRKEAVEDYLACLSECNLRASAILTSPLNYIDILKDIAESQRFTCEMVLDLEYLDSTLSLYIDKKLYFTRTLPFFVDSFTRSLVGTLFSDKGKVELTLNDAEEIRDTVGIPQDETASIRDNLQASQVISLVRPVLESLVREIKHSITYFTSHLGEVQPQVIYISGFGADMKHLDTYLAKEIGLPVSRLPFPDILDTRRIAPDRLARDRSQLASCVGAVLSANRGVSLLAGDVRMRWVKNVLIKRLKPFFSAIGVLILFFMFISVLMIPVFSYRLIKAKSYFNDKKLLFSFFEKARLGRELNYEVSLQRVTADALLNFISQSVPDALRLSELELDQYRGELALQGEARQAQDVDVFVSKLKASDYFSGVNELDSRFRGNDEQLRVSVNTTKGTDRTFKIICKLKY